MNTNVDAIQLNAQMITMLSLQYNILNLRKIPASLVLTLVAQTTAVLMLVLIHFIQPCMRWSCWSSHFPSVLRLTIDDVPIIDTLIFAVTSALDEYGDGIRNVTITNDIARKIHSTRTLYFVIYNFCPDDYYYNIYKEAFNSSSISNLLSTL